MGAPLVAHFRQARIFFDDRCGDGAELGDFRMIFGIGGKQALPERGEFRHGRQRGIDEFELRAGTAGKDGAQPIVRDLRRRPSGRSRCRGAAADN